MKMNDKPMTRRRLRAIRALQEAQRMSELNNAGQHVQATATPNVVIENPTTRKIVRTTLDVIGGLAFIVSAADAVSPAFDLGAFTLPILTGYAAARVVFGFAVDTPNTPNTPNTPKADA